MPPLTETVAIPLLFPQVVFVELATSVGPPAEFTIALAVAEQPPVSETVTE